MDTPVDDIITGNGPPAGRVFNRDASILTLPRVDVPRLEEGKRDTSKARLTIVNRGGYSRL